MSAPTASGVRPTVLLAAVACVAATLSLLRHADVAERIEHAATTR